jgi:hypothetical protein
MNENDEEQYCRRAMCWGISANAGPGQQTITDVLEKVWLDNQNHEEEASIPDKHLQTSTGFDQPYSK